MRTGGPVFPRTYDDVDHEGLSIRQFYKAAAMKGLLAGRQNTKAPPAVPGRPRPDYLLAAVVDHAADLADAMLAEDAKHAEEEPR
jgi:hypothetical protein